MDRHKVLILNSVVMRSVCRTYFSLLLISFLCLAMISCHSGAKTSNSVGHKQVANCDTIIHLEDNLQVFDISVDDSLLVLLTGGNPMFYAVDLHRNVVCKKFGYIGRASNEYYMRPHQFNIRNHMIQFLDGSRKMMCYISLPGLKQSERPVPYTSEFRPSRAVDVEGNIIAVGSFSDTRLGHVDPEGKICQTDFSYPFDTGDVEGIYRGSVFQSDVRIPQTRASAFVYALSSDSYEIYDVDDAHLERVYSSPVENAPKLYKMGSRTGIDHNKSKAGIMQTSVTDKGIFLISSDETYNEAAKNGFIGDLVKEYDWNGSFVTDYRLPFPVSAFCVAENVLYAVSEDIGGTVIVRVPLSSK